ncbi:MAG: RluA family pseudouridine synthase [Ruminococcus sp.]|nr:RluA family pseudouridine synthase [Ruminococcus sp.]
MKEFKINENDSGQRVDKFISKALPDMPKSMMYRLIRKKDIKLNGKRCTISDRLSVGDVVTVYVKEELATEKKQDLSFMSAPGDLQVIYEDENILIAFKPEGLDSHSNGENSADTLINRIKRRLYEKGEFRPESESSFAPALCSRLDRNTSGLVTAAKTAAALREVNEAISSGNIRKIYRCVTASPPPKSSDIITAYHRKDSERNIVRISDAPTEGYKEIRTGYQVLAKRGSLCLVQVTLYTGRTHQIRAHLAHVGAPVLGDGKYGNIAANKRFGVFRQALCAYALRFSFPESSPLSYLNETEIKAPPPGFQERFFPEIK